MTHIEYILSIIDYIELNHRNEVRIIFNKKIKGRKIGVIADYQSIDEYESDKYNFWFKFINLVRFEKDEIIYDIIIRPYITQNRNNIINDLLKK